MIQLRLVIILPYSKHIDVARSAEGVLFFPFNRTGSDWLRNP